MGAKQYLMQVKRLDDMVNAKLEQIEALRSIATKITTDYSGAEKVQSTHQNDIYKKQAIDLLKIGLLKCLMPKHGLQQNSV